MGNPPREIHMSISVCLFVLSNRLFLISSLMLCQLRTMASVANRVLVNFIKDYSSPVKADFTESILDTLGLVTGNDMPVYAELKDNCLMLSNKPHSQHQKPVKIQRPPFCPLHCMDKVQQRELPEETRSRGIDVGCAVLLEAGDGKILLTRRSSHLRTFPSVWVPPGGHVEFGENLTEAGLRELCEETGLVISPSQCVDNKISVLALWESAYPPMLSSGLPKRHHAVVYLHAKLTSDLTSLVLQDQLHLDPSEVGASAWIDRKLITAIVKVREGTNQTDGLHVGDLPETISATVIQADGTPTKEDLQTSVLLQTAPGDENDIERISTGTRFALKEWLLRKHSKKH